MAGSFSDYTEDKILDHIVAKTSFTMPTHVWVGLSKADPLDDASGNDEHSGDSYARVETAGADWDASSGGAIANAAAITFPVASGAWGEMTHFTLWDAVTVGNMLAHGELTVAKTVGNGDTFEFAIGDLGITLT